LTSIETAYVHIGFEKTGSTSLFNTLRASREGLAAHGVLFPDIEDVHVALPLALGNHSEGRKEKLKIEDEEALAERVRRTLSTLEEQLAAFRGETAVISSEMLAGLAIPALERLRDLLGRYARAVKLVAYVRHPVSQAISHSQQSVKNGHTTRAAVDVRPPRRHYQHRLRQQAAAFGAENMIVRPFETASLAGGRIQSDFLSVIGWSGPAEAITTVDSNASLTMPALVLKDLMNQAFGVRIPNFKAFYRLPGARWTLPEAALAIAAREGEGDLSYLREAFGIEFAPLVVEPRRPLESYFTSEVMAAFATLPETALEGSRALIAYHSAISAIKARNFDAPLPAQIEAARRRVRREKKMARLSPLGLLSRLGKRGEGTDGGAAPVAGS
jgi:hypothetical protein